MYVVINIDPGSTLNELMAFMTQKTITFSVTDQLSRLCDRTVNPERREVATQTDEKVENDREEAAEHGGGPASKRLRMCSNTAPTVINTSINNNNESNTSREDEGGSTSPSSSATPSEPGSKGLVLRGLIKAAAEQPERSIVVVKQEEPEEASVEDDITTDFMQNQLIQALFPKSQNNLNGFVTLQEADSLENDASAHDLHHHHHHHHHHNGSTTPTPTTHTGSFQLDAGGSSASAIRYKPAYASTKRGVCHVCNREVSLITTHRRRHAITHLGFKTLKCSLCHKFFSRQDLATGHFKKDHPEAEFTPFIDTMTNEDERQLVVMMELCFPEENLVRKRPRDSSEPAAKNEDC